MMIVKDKNDLAEHAAEHGVDFHSVIAPSKKQRLAQLSSVLSRKKVPYPIPVDKAQSYYQLAASGVSFGISTLR